MPFVLEILPSINQIKACSIRNYLSCLLSLHSPKPDCMMFCLVAVIIAFFSLCSTVRYNYIKDTHGSFYISTVTCHIPKIFLRWLVSCTCMVIEEEDEDLWKCPTTSPKSKMIKKSYIHESVQMRLRSFCVGLMKIYFQGSTWTLLRPSSESLLLIRNYTQAPLGTLCYPITSQVSVQCMPCTPRRTAFQNLRNTSTSLHVPKCTSPEKLLFWGYVF